MWKRRLKLFDLQIFAKVGAPWGGRGSAEDEISPPLFSRRRCCSSGGGADSGRSRAREARRTTEAQGGAQDTQFDIIDKVMDARPIFEIADKRNFGELRARRVDRVGLLLQQHERGRRPRGDNAQVIGARLHVKHHVHHIPGVRLQLEQGAKRIRRVVEQGSVQTNRCCAR